jgi:peptide/nickel transport system substrate-binding protein
VVFRFISDPAAQIAALKAGDIDVIGYVAAPESAMILAKDKRFKVYAGTTTGEVIMSTNNKAAPFDNRLVRRAMAHAIDRQAVVELVMFGYGTPHRLPLVALHPLLQRSHRSLALRSG